MSIDIAVSSLRDARAELLRELELVERALELLAPTPPSGLVVAAPSASAAPEVVSPPVSPPRAAGGQPNGKRGGKGPNSKYTDAQKRKAVALVGEIGLAKAAKQLNISTPTLCKWRIELRPVIDGEVVESAVASPLVDQFPRSVVLSPPPAPGRTSKVSFADRVRAETADIEQRRKALDESRLIRIAEANATAAAAAQARDDRPKAAMVPSGLPRQPIDHDAVRRNQFPRDDL